MSKELKMLEIIGETPTCWENNIPIKELYPNNYKLIKDALERLEEYDKKATNFVFTSRNDVEKMLKALEIIKEHIIRIIDDDKLSDVLTIRFRKFDKIEEFELLKEMLK